MVDSGRRMQFLKQSEASVCHMTLVAPQLALGILLRLIARASMIWLQSWAVTMGHFDGFCTVMNMYGNTVSHLHIQLTVIVVLFVLSSHAFEMYPQWPLLIHCSYIFVSSPMFENDIAFTLSRQLFY